MGRLTTHVLDTANGRPAAGIRISVRQVADGVSRELRSVITNSDGRCDSPLLEGADLRAGVYELVFHVDEYFAASGRAVDEPPFLGEVVLRFGIAKPDEHYHVPLLLSPYGYSTYRGS